MKDVTTRRSLELAEGVYRRGTKMDRIIVDGWARGFRKSQTRHECIQMGYPLCIVEKAIDTIWQEWDDSIYKLEQEQKMRDDIRVNGYKVVIYAEYRAGTEGDWMSSTSAGGPYTSTKSLNEDMARLISEKPEGWDLAIEFQEGEVYE